MPGRRSVRTRRSGWLAFLPFSVPLGRARRSPLVSLYLSGLLRLPGPVCALCGTVCPSVRPSVALSGVINGPRSQTVLWETVSVRVSLSAHGGEWLA